MLGVLTIQVGIIEENCYAVYDDGAEASYEYNGRKEKPCVLIDPGDQPGKIKNELEALSLIPCAILLTHAHFDHIGAIKGIRDYCPGIPVYAYKEEKVIIDNPGMSGGRSRKPNPWANSVTYLDDGTELDIAGAHIKLLATPGHTAGSCCYYVEDSKLLFAGDTLFAGSCGRTDFPTGSMSAIVDSIRRVLMSLPDDTLVLPGHMGSTYIGTERKYNFIMRM